MPITKTPLWSRFFIYYLPTAFFASVAMLDKPHPTWGITGPEWGLVENLQALILLGAFFTGVILLRRHWKICPPWLRAWLIIATICSLYVFLEEISYGQQFFHWRTPEVWDHINDQHETNLHNTSSWFDQKPRLILEIGVIVGGLLMPLLRRFKPQALPQKFAIIYSASCLWLVALLPELAHIHQGVLYYTHHRDWGLFDRSSEMQEISFYYFVLLYLVMLGRRLRIYQRTHIPIAA